MKRRLIKTFIFFICYSIFHLLVILIFNGYTAPSILSNVLKNIAWFPCTILRIDLQNSHISTVLISPLIYSILFYGISYKLEKK